MNPLSVYLLPSAGHFSLYSSVAVQAGREEKWCRRFAAETQTSMFQLLSSKSSSASSAWPAVQMIFLFDTKTSSGSSGVNFISRWQYQQTQKELPLDLIG